MSDYGSANFLSKVTTVGPGNASYAAPESMNPKLQSPKMDVYSYGILMLAKYRPTSKDIRHINFSI